VKPVPQSHIFYFANAFGLFYHFASFEANKHLLSPVSIPQLKMANYNRPGVVTENQKNVVLAWWKKVTAANPKAENFQRLRVPVVGKID
jgi:hypothetical protein